MFATVVLVIPSAYTSGQIHLSHDSQTQIIDMAAHPLEATSTAPSLHGTPASRHVSPSPPPQARPGYLHDFKVTTNCTNALTYWSAFEVRITSVGCSGRMAGTMWRGTIHEKTPSNE